MTGKGAAGFSDRGRRPKNEDRFHVHGVSGLLVVADGMGRGAGGEFAAQLAIDVIIDYLERPAAVFGHSTCGFDTIALAECQPASDRNLRRTSAHY